MSKVNRPIIVILTLFIMFDLIAANRVSAQELFNGRPKKERCALLTEWMAPIYNLVRPDRDIERLCATRFNDTTFRLVFGKSYWALSTREKKEIADSLRNCFTDWRATLLTRAFEPEPSEKWILAIQKVQPPTFSLSTAPHRGDSSRRDRSERKDPESTIEWFSLGLRVAAREVRFQSAIALLPVVIAVRDKSPGYYAGVMPGDAVSFLKCGSWKYNFIDQIPHGTSYFPRYSDARQTDRQLPFAMRAQATCQAGLEVLFSVAAPTGDERQMKQFILAQSADNVTGAWISDKQTIIGGRQKARDDLQGRYDELRRRAFTELRNAPCSYDVSNAYNLRAMPPIIRELSSLRASIGQGEEFMPYWRDVIVTYCDEEKNGRLPSFEAALKMISRGALDPCAYDPNLDYSAIPPDPSKGDRPYSRTEYDLSTNFLYFQNRISTEAQRQCFYDLVRSQLTGKKWTPRTTTPAKQ